MQDAGIQVSTEDQDESVHQTEAPGTLAVGEAEEADQAIHMLPGQLGASEGDDGGQDHPLGAPALLVCLVSVIQT